MKTFSEVSRTIEAKKLWVTLLLMATTLAMYATEGAMRGVFSVSATKKVCFSQGNLQYQASTDTWRFADEQYNVIGADNVNVSDTYAGYIDLFGWGTGGAPTKAELSEDYSTWTDWGTNAISNGENLANSWYTMTAAEWYYLFVERPNAATLFALGNINGTNGLILLPDRWQTPSGSSLVNAADEGLTWDATNNRYDASSSVYALNTYTINQWKTLENLGAVFLPAAGSRQGTGENCVNSVNSNGYYWMPDNNTGNNKTALTFQQKRVKPNAGNSPYNAYCVRLVSPCIDTIKVNFEFPEAGENVVAYITPSSSAYNVLGKVTLPENAHYEVISYAFYSADGNSISESKFNPNTSYKVQVIVRAKAGYTFPLYIHTTSPWIYDMALYMNDELLDPLNCNRWNNQTIGLNFVFTTGDADLLATPVFSDTHSWIQDTTHIAMTCGTEGASIYYTTDGSTPTATNGTLYSTPLAINVTAENENTDLTLKAVAVKDNAVSEVVSHTYSLKRTECQLTLLMNNTSWGTASMPASAKYGDEVTITAAPNDGCQLDSIVVSCLGKISGNTFVVPANCTKINVIVYFYTPSFHVTVETPQNGRLVVTSGGALADLGLPFYSGTKILVTVYPDDGYELDQAVGFTPGEELVVTADITLSATFKKKTYTVTVIAEHGTVTAKDDLDNVIDLTQPIEHGTHIWLTVTPDDTYYLWRWEDYSEQEGLIVTNDVTVTANILQYSSYHVTFVDYDDTVLKEEDVFHGRAATAPADPEREGYTFTGWDADFSNVTSDLVVKALYEPAQQEGVENQQGNMSATKLLRNGQVLIRRADKTYTLQGQELK